MQRTKRRVQSRLMFKAIFSLFCVAWTLHINPLVPHAQIKVHPGANPTVTHS